MLYEYIRVFNSDNGTLTDESLINQEDGSVLSFAFTAAEDYKYIAKFSPFNNFFIQIDTANTDASVMSIDYYDGSNWRAAVDVLDGTSTSGVTLAKSGVVQFSPNISYGWQRVNDTSDNNSPTELQTLNVYDAYWLRIKFSANPSAGTDVKKIAYAFTTTQQLNDLDIKIDKFFNTFATGKTDWQNEIMTASIHVVKDMMSRGLIREEGQLLRLSDVSLATDYKTLELICAALGPNQEKKREYWRSKYNEVLSQRVFSIDKDGDGRLDRQEISGTTGSLVR